jgi:hypothetical protein
MSTRSMLAFVVALGFGGALVAVGCGNSDNSLVGGSCAASYTECSLRCVDVQIDPENCGACGVVCKQGGCAHGMCTGDGDASGDGASDGSMDGSMDGSSDGSPGDGNGGEGDGAATDGTVTDTSPTDSCAPPYVTAAHCGDCFTVCSGTNDTCKVADGGVFVCGPLCSPPTTNCGGTCVNENNDPDNCGACGRVCASSICTTGICQGAANGAIVYIGHDYAGTPFGTSQARELSNAVFLGPFNPIRILSFEKFSAPGSVAKAKSILTQAAMASGRTIVFTVSTTATDIPSNLVVANYDVLLVYDQVAAPSGTLAPIGAGWRTTLTTFTHLGGVFITLDGDTMGDGGAGGEMPLFETATGQLIVASHTAMPVGTLMTVIAPADTVGNSVVSPYAARKNSAHFSTEANGGAVVYVAIEQASTQPVVVHKIAP